MIGWARCLGREVTYREGVVVTVVTGLRLPRGGPRRRGLPSPDVVEFIAACPACGADCVWLEERDETRVETTVICPCGVSPAPTPGPVDLH